MRLSSFDQIIIRHDWSTIDHLNQLIDETETAIADQSLSDHWQESMTCLIRFPGICLYIGMNILTAISDIQRFTHPVN